MELGWLCPVKFAPVQTTIDLTRGDTGDMSKQANELIVCNWLSLAQGQRKSTIVFAASIAHADGLTEMFKAHGIGAQLITSKTSLKDRKERLDDFKEGKYPVLVNKGIFTEGSDIPNIDCVVLTRLTHNTNLLVQMIGRGLRLWPGKRDCLVIYFRNPDEAGIVPTPALFGLGPDLSADSKRNTPLPPHTNWKTAASNSQTMHFLAVTPDDNVVISPNSVKPKCFDVTSRGNHYSSPSYGIARGVKTLKTAIRIADGYARARAMFPGEIVAGGYICEPVDLHRHGLVDLPKFLPLPEDHADDLHHRGPVDLPKCLPLPDDYVDGLHRRGPVDQPKCLPPPDDYADDLHHRGPIDLPKCLPLPDGYVEEIRTEKAAGGRDELDGNHLEE